jgi:hypothetical protein
MIPFAFWGMVVLAADGTMPITLSKCIPGAANQTFGTKTVPPNVNALGVSVQFSSLVEFCLEITGSDSLWVDPSLALVPSTRYDCYVSTHIVYLS